MKNQSGVYEILNTVNGKRYIGQAKKFGVRWGAHVRRLKRGVHHSPKLQNAWNKYGEASFKFLPMLVCDESMLDFYEQQLLDKVKPEYNIALDVTAPMRGRALSEDHRRKLSLAGIGRPMSDENRAKVSARFLGVPLPLEHRNKLSVAKKGKKRGPHSIVTREKIGRGNRGKIISSEARKKNADSHLGKKLGPHSVEHKANISKALTGVRKSIAGRTSMSIAKLGKPLSEAHRLSIMAGKAAAAARRAAQIRVQ